MYLGHNYSRLIGNFLMIYECPQLANVENLLMNVPN